MTIWTTELAEATCSAPADRSDRMCAIVVAHTPGERPIRLLDLGCGTGALLFRLATALPRATLMGIDLSRANIRAAESKRARLDAAAADRIRFERADYLDYRTPPVDVLVSDGVLQFVAGPTRPLFEKLADDLVPGGILVVDMAYDCVSNRMLGALRRMLGAVRTPSLDALILRAGGLVHGRVMDEEGLRERLPYMYLPPVRVADRALRDRLAPSVGLRVVRRHPMARASVSQLKHEVIVFERQS